MRAYLLTSGVVFTLLAFVAVRLLHGWSAVIGGWELPLSISWMALAAAVGLGTWAFALFTLESAKSPGTENSLEKGPPPKQRGLRNVNLSVVGVVSFALIILIMELGMSTFVDMVWNITAEFLKKS